MAPARPSWAREYVTDHPVAPHGTAVRHCADGLTETLVRYFTAGELDALISVDVTHLNQQLRIRCQDGRLTVDHSAYATGASAASFR